MSYILTYIPKPKDQTLTGVRITAEELDTLVNECPKLIADPTYRSDALYWVLEQFTKSQIQYLFLHCLSNGYKEYYKDTALIERLILDSIIKCYRSIPKYDFDRGQDARVKRGRKPNPILGLVNYIKVITRTSLLTSLTAHTKQDIRLKKFVSFDSVFFSDVVTFKKSLKVDDTTDERQRLDPAYAGDIQDLEERIDAYFAGRTATNDTES